MEPAHRRRLKRYDLPNESRFLTFSCFHRRPFLTSDRTRQWLVEAIGRARERHGFHLWGWVAMPEHVHLLVYPEPENPVVGSILITIKQSVAQRCLAWVREHAPEFLDRMADAAPDGRVVHRFWQRGGGYDRNITTPRRVRDAIDYIHGNPVNRGLCDRALDWEWSSALVFAGQEGVLSLDLQGLPDRLGRD